MWSDKTHTMLFAVKLCLHDKVLGLQLFFFSGKSTTFGFLVQKGVWSYRYAYDIPLVALILNICGSSSILFSGKSTIMALLIQKGVCMHRY